MTKLVEKLDQKLVDSSAYFANGQLHYAGSDCSYPRFIVVSAQHVLERKSFFKVKKRKDLALALSLFAKKSDPFDDSYTWTDALKVDDGFFVVAYYIEQSLYQELLQLQKQGGLILPEQALVRKMSKPFLGAVENHGNYTLDPNYKVQFTLPKAQLISQLLSNDANETSLAQFTTLLLKSISLQKLISFWRAFHQGANKKFGFKVAHLLVAIGLPLIYFAATSAWLYWKHDKAYEQFQLNRAILSEFKGLEREYLDKRTQLTQFAEPFKDYLYSYVVFDVMNDMDVFVSIQTFTINSTEISINGVSDDASAVFKKLSEDSRLVDLRYVRPVRKSGKRDAFTIGFKLADS
ncbi:hypothetical protein AN214_01186 [Pseudoalteromonas sp. P1-9]|uniref:hypothetical protein n=1 Tax=Pseudoalteromonas sp. P1-9 TaxID=1710354 RepID=UPI0006D5F078|nr:hypothetical protein [Pseudoalteromonas sp. P1-9]KPV96726.1 hypothetical protein AN214_01186 [Pseudoalteromonas sp. P1-9]